MDQKILIGLVISIVLLILIISIIIVYMMKRNEHYATDTIHIQQLDPEQLKQYQQQWLQKIYNQHQPSIDKQHPLYLVDQQQQLQKQEQQRKSGKCGDKCVGDNCSTLADKFSNETIDTSCSYPEKCAKVGTEKNYFNMCLTNDANKELS